MIFWAQGLRFIVWGYIAASVRLRPPSDSEFGVQGLESSNVGFFPSNR